MSGGREQPAPESPVERQGLLVARVRAVSALLLLLVSYVAFWSVISAYQTPVTVLRILFLWVVQELPQAVSVSLVAIGIGVWRADRRWGWILLLAGMVWWLGLGLLVIGLET